MARAPENPDLVSIYDLTQRWIDECLLQDGSLFEADQKIWTLTNLERLIQDFNEAPDLGSGSFFDKLSKQLADSPAQVVQLLAEVFSVHLLPTNKITAATKNRNVRQVLDLMSDDPPPLPDDFLSAFQGGVMNPGTAYNTYRPYQLFLIIDFAAAFKRLDPGERQRLLDEPAAFKTFLGGIDYETAHSQFHLLLHLIHPDHFEAMSSQDHKQQIIAAFPDMVGDSNDDDDKLLSIRHQVIDKAGGGSTFYDPGLRRRWQPDHAKVYDRLAEFAPLWLGTHELADDEVDYKLELGTQLHDVLTELREDWIDEVGRLLGGTNLVSWRTRANAVDWMREHDDQSRELVERLLDEDDDVASSVEAWSDALGDETGRPGGLLSVVSALLLATGPQYAPYRAQFVSDAHNLLGESEPNVDVGPGERYAAWLDLLDVVIDQLAHREVVVEDRVTAQSLLWAMVNDQSEHLGNDVRASFQQWRADRLGEPSVEASPGIPEREIERRRMRVRRLEDHYRELLDDPEAKLTPLDRDGEAVRRAFIDLAAALRRGDDPYDAFGAAFNQDVIPPVLQQGGLRIFPSSLVKHGGDPAIELLADAVALPDTFDHGLEMVRSVMAAADEVGTAISPARSTAVPFLATVWALQDPEIWTPWSWGEQSRFPEWVGWMQAQKDPLDRYVAYHQAITSLTSDGWTASHAISSLSSGNSFFGLDPSLAVRARENARLGAAWHPRTGHANDNDGPRALDNAQTLVGECASLGHSLSHELQTVFGVDLRRGTPTLRMDETAPERADGWVRFAPTGDQDAQFRIWITPDAVWVGAAIPHSEDIVAPEGLDVWSIQTDTTRTHTRFTTDRGVRAFVGMRFDADEALDRVGFRDDVIDVATAARPLLRAQWGRDDQPEDLVDLTDADARIGELAATFHEEVGYPTLADRDEQLVLDGLRARLLDTTRDELDVVSLQTLVGRRILGTRPAATTFLTAMSSAAPEPLARLRRSVQHLLADPGPVQARHNDVLSHHDDLGFEGLGSQVIGRILSLADDGWLAIGDTDQLRDALAKLDIAAAQDHDTDRARLETVAQRVLEPHFGRDRYGMSRFLQWLHSRDDQGLESVDRIAEAAEELLIDESYLRDWNDLLQDKRQLIFYGPPGTGKTYVAQRLAQALAPREEDRRLIQFHPSSSYEDFFEGFRPHSDDTGMTYRLTPGPLVRMAEHAKANPGRDHVLVIDEINRANLPRVFGELLFLLEYRDRSIRPLYRPDEPFTLPKNLLIIGTMNTADHSIALIDAALRRRFHFVAMFPHESPVQELLGAWLDREHEDADRHAGPGSPATRVDWAGFLAAVNADLRRDLGGPDLQIGPSHFMRSDLDREQARKIWTYSIFPYIEDQLFGRRDRIEAYRWERVAATHLAAHTAELGDDLDHGSGVGLHAPTDDGSTTDNGPPDVERGDSDASADPDDPNTAER